MFVACVRPLYAFKDTSSLSETGKPVMRFIKAVNGNKPVSDKYDILTVPCGQCIGCRLDHSRRWAVRMMHEAQMHDENCFITLTYNDEHLPADGSLHLDHFQKFMKRFRKVHGDLAIRFFHCGEYGDLHGRPHYHAIIFGYDFPDKKRFRLVSNDTVGEIWYYVSDELQKLWSINGEPIGHCLIGEVTFESCAYVARYILKKITGDKADAHYNGRTPEYITMSRRPGIGFDFYMKYFRDIYPKDQVVDARGFKTRPPAYYDKLYEREFPAAYAKIKEGRAVIGEKIKDADFLRLIQKEEAKQKQIERLIRPLEKEL